MANFIEGKDLMLFDASGHSLAFATNHVLTISTESADVSTKDHGAWGASKVTKINWEITTDNLYTNEGFAFLFDKMVAKEEMDIFFGVKADNELDKQGLVHANGEYDAEYWTSAKDQYTYKGAVVLTSLTANAANGENATFSATFTAAGPLTKVTA